MNKLLVPVVAVTGTVMDAPCPRCESETVRLIAWDATEADGAPLFECRDCGFEWGEAVAALFDR
jgi:hypothetical protein